MPCQVNSDEYLQHMFPCRKISKLLGFGIKDFISSPEQEMLKLSYCDHPVSVMRLCVIRF